MKKLIYLVLALFAIFLISACKGSGENKLFAVCEKMNSVCPIAVPHVGEVSKFSIEDSLLVLTCDVTNDKLTYKDMNARKDEIRSQLAPVIVSLTGANLGQIMRDAQAGICYRYKWADDQTLDFKFTSEQLAEMSK